MSRIGNNLNQIARWANTHKGATEAIEIVARLVAIEPALRALASVASPETELRHAWRLRAVRRRARRLYREERVAEKLRTGMRPQARMGAPKNG